MIKRVNMKSDIISSIITKDSTIQNESSNTKDAIISFSAEDFLMCLRPLQVAPACTPHP
jgi:hypothetical protein